MGANVKIMLLVKTRIYTTWAIAPTLLVFTFILISNLIEH